MLAQVAQLNLYVSDDLADRLKREARKAHLPLSRYVLFAALRRATGRLAGGLF